MSHLAFIQNLGATELIIVFVIVLLIFGPKALPKLGRSLGEGIREFRGATKKMTDAMNEDEPEETRPRTMLPPESAPPSSAAASTKKESEKLS